MRTPSLFTTIGPSSSRVMRCAVPPGEVTSSVRIDDCESGVAAASGAGSASGAPGNLLSELLSMINTFANEL